MAKEFGTLFLFLAGGFVLSLVVMFINWFLRPKNPGSAKSRTYECGLDTEGPTWVQFKISYYLYALIFVVFDVEVVFLYPWAASFKNAGFFPFVEMVVFIGILALGIWYAWKKGAFEWN
jgi:NADH:ubiquinone oxidoreductase subunit 3 (subunit A)